MTATTSSVVSAVVRVVLTVSGIVLIVLAKRCEWLFWPGVMLAAIGAAQVLRAAREGALEARREMERARFGHVKFEDERQPKNPWSN